jgi:hypothetical protein
MQIIKHPHEVNRITDADLRLQVTQRFRQLVEDAEFQGIPFVAEEMGYMIVVEPMDSIADLETHAGPILQDYIQPSIAFGEPNFLPSFEVLASHPSCYEMIFIINGDYGVDLFIPKHAGINAKLLAFCQEYSEPIEMYA